MAREQNFDALVASIQNAFLEVNQLSELQHLEMIQKYFDEDGKPKCMLFQIPTGEKNEEEEIFQQVNIPLIAMVPMSSLKMEEVGVDFKVKLAGKVKLKENDKLDNDYSQSSKNSDRKNKGTYLGYMQGSNRDNMDSYASVHIKFKADDTPEGIMRVRDNLIKIIM